MFVKSDILILLLAWAVIWGTALTFDPSSLILYLITYAVIALGVSAHFILEEIREEGAFHLRSPRSRRRSGAKL